jgi:hypothetical protein
MEYRGSTTPRGEPPVALIPVSQKIDCGSAEIDADSFAVNPSFRDGQLRHSLLGADFEWCIELQA